MGALKNYLSDYFSHIARTKAKPGLGDFVDNFTDDNVVALHGKIDADGLFGESFRSPLLAMEGVEIEIKDEVEHAFFLRSCELYRVLELLTRSTPSLIETYSKYRERKQFEETLRFRFFNSEDALLAKFDPNLTATQQAVFNHIHELRIYLRYTDALPSTVQQRILESTEIMIENWNLLVEGLYGTYCWNFKKL